MHKTPRALFRISVLLLAAAASLAGCESGEERQRRLEAAMDSAVDRAVARLDADLDTAAGRFAEVEGLASADEGALRRYLNPEHLERARRLGIERGAGEAEIERLVEAGRLVRLADTTRYWITEEFDYSVPYVTPDTKRLLEEIGRRFHARLEEKGLPLYRFIISSALRSAESQAALRQVNPNAARGASTHEFGTTVDLLYHEFSYLPREEEALPDTRFTRLDERLEDVRTLSYEGLGMRSRRELRGILGRTLLELQEEGAVMVTLERQQPVFHITVAEEMAGA